MKKIAVFLLALMTSFAIQAADLSAVMAGEQRSEANRARDQYRHPVQTLEFFRLAPDMTVVEIWPGAGWYTEILAPYLKEKGTYYAAHFSPESPVAYYNKSRTDFVQKLVADQDSYGEVTLTEFNPAAGRLSVPQGSADLVLTFRNVHNWLQSDSEQKAFELFFATLKPGGLLGVVEHRAKGDQDRAWMLKNGYMTEQAVIKLAENAGFKLLERSEVNANAKDSADHPAGVWTLPPSLRLGEKDKASYLAIGESDRMTLLFAKPE